MRRVAAHWLYLPDGRKIHLPVVELTGDDVLNYYPIEDELPMTEWLGGIFILSSMRGDVSLQTGDSLEVILEKLQAGERSYPLHCWYLSDFARDSDSATSLTRLTLLKEEDPSPEDELIF